MEEATHPHATPLHRWVEASGKEVLSQPIGAVKRCSGPSDINGLALDSPKSRLTYWAAHTDLGLKFGAAHTRLVAARQASAAIRKGRHAMKAEHESSDGMTP